MGWCERVDSRTCAFPDEPEQYGRYQDAGARNIRGPHLHHAWSARCVGFHISRDVRHVKAGEMVSRQGEQLWTPS